MIFTQIILSAVKLLILFGLTKYFDHFFVTKHEITKHKFTPLPPVPERMVVVVENEILCMMNSSQKQFVGGMVILLFI